MTPTIPTDPDDPMREAVRERMLNCVALMMRDLAGEHRSCGRAACARAGRCRGLACGWLGDEDAPVA